MSRPHRPKSRRHSKLENPKGSGPPKRSGAGHDRSPGGDRKRYPSGPGPRSRSGSASAPPHSSPPDRSGIRAARFEDAYAVEVESQSFADRSASRSEAEERREEGSGWTTGFHAVRTALEHHPERVERVMISRDQAQARGKVIAALAHEKRIPFQHVPPAALDRVAAGINHQGFALKLSAAETIEASELIERLPAEALVVVLDGVEDPRNLGAVIRSAAAFRADAVFIPDRRAAGLGPAAVRTAAGGASLVPIGRAHNLGQCLDRLREAGFRLIALDQGGVTPYWDAPLRGRTALVAGGEEKGVRPTILARCDHRIGIPIDPAIGSLNVSVAVGVLLAHADRGKRGS